jgi:ankyrin repeat protein
MSDALPLPARPRADHYLDLARDFHRLCHADPDTAVWEWADDWPELHGQAPLLERIWRRLRQSEAVVARSTGVVAHMMVARAHGFATWPDFEQFLHAMEHGGSAVRKFEAAADAIAGGDIAALRSLLAANPALPRERSLREHRSTLLHYVSANGIEDFRQKTPPNIVEIATLLLDAGAEVNAESEAYGGGSTALNLTATSCHPHEAGVQIPLLELLLSRGALIGGRDVVSCLRNGRGEAAAFLASRGAPLDFEGAAGTARLDLVRSLLADTPPQQRIDGFAWACEFGHTAVVEFLLQQGAVAVGQKLPHYGQTGLHWAAWEGHAATVALLLDRGAPVDAREDEFHGTPLDWALYRWANTAREHADFLGTVARLVRAGARLDPGWFDGDDEERQHTIRKVRSDPRMLAALDGGTGN